MYILFIVICSKAKLIHIDKHIHTNNTFHMTFVQQDKQLADVYIVLIAKKVMHCTNCQDGKLVFRCFFFCCFTVLYFDYYSFISIYPTVCFRLYCFWSGISLMVNRCFGKVRTDRKHWKLWKLDAISKCENTIINNAHYKHVCVIDVFASSGCQ